MNRQTCRFYPRQTKKIAARSAGLQRWRVKFEPPFEEPLKKRFIVVLEVDRKVGIARMTKV